jgi:hypothetical protein
MDLFFDSCVSRSVKKASDDAFYNVTDALQHIFSTSAFVGDLELILHGKTLARINADARGAATYRFRTVSGIGVVAEIFYAQARRELAKGSCSFVGPPFSPASVVGFKANPEKLQVRIL